MSTSRDDARALLDELRSPENRAARRSCRTVDLGAIAVPLLSERTAVVRRLVSTAGDAGWLWRSDVLSDDAEREKRLAQTDLTRQLIQHIEAAGATVPPPEPEPPPPGRAVAALLQWEKEDQVAGAAGGYAGPDAWHGRHESRLLQVGEIALRTAGIALRAAYTVLAGAVYEPSDLYESELLAADAEAKDQIAKYMVRVSQEMSYWTKVTDGDQQLIFRVVMANPQRADEEGGGSSATDWNRWLGLDTFQGQPQPAAQRIAAAGWQVPAEPRPK